MDKKLPAEEVNGRGDCETAAATTCAGTALEEEVVDFDLDENLLHLGVVGFYPSGLYLFLSFLVFLTPCQYMSSHVSSFTPQHRCKLPPNTTSSSSTDSFVDIEDFIPKRVVGGVETFARCERYEFVVDDRRRSGAAPSSESPDASSDYAVFNTSRGRTVPCDHGWEYDNVTSGLTVVVDFDLVCAKTWIPGFTTSILNVGQAFGGLLVQPMGDRIGRKWMMMMSYFFLGLTGVLTATLANDIIIYCVFKFFLGAFFAGALLSTFVMSIELYAGKHRMSAGMAVEPIWGLGSAMVGVAAFAFPAWRDYSLAISLPAFSCVAIFFIYPPDSLPWLMVNGRQREAKDYLERQLKAKGKKLHLLSENEKLVPDLARVSKPASTTLVDEDVVVVAAGETTKTMLTNGRVLKQLVIFAFVSTVNSLVYYALSLMSTDLSGDRNVSLFLSGIVEVPGYILAWVSLQFLGRRGPTILFHLLVGFFMVIVALIQVAAPVPITSAIDIFSQICYFGAKLSISASYAIIFLYVPEAFPTNVRNTCVGIVDAIARLGGVVAPFSSLFAAASHASVPVFLFAGFAFAAAALILFLPEVHGEALPDTLEDLERLANGTKMWSFTGKRKEIKRRRGSSVVARKSSRLGGGGKSGAGGTTTSTAAT